MIASEESPKTLNHILETMDFCKTTQKRNRKKKSYFSLEQPDGQPADKQANISFHPWSHATSMAKKFNSAILQ